MTDSWTWVDAWVLAALPRTDPSPDLCDMIAIMDALNHAIPTRAELASALGALIGAGLVEATPLGFRATSLGEEARAAWDGAPVGWDGAILPALSRYERPDREWPISDQDVADAYREYRDRLR